MNAQGSRNPAKARRDPESAGRTHFGIGRPAVLGCGITLPTRTQVTRQQINAAVSSAYAPIVHRSSVVIRSAGNDSHFREYL